MPSPGGANQKDVNNILTGTLSLKFQITNKDSGLQFLDHNNSNNNLILIDEFPYCVPFPNP